MDVGGSCLRELSKMDCAAKGTGFRCIGSPVRLCARCRAVAYCSLSHQILNWSAHKDECERFEEQMKILDVLNAFPFTFSREVGENQKSRCSFLRQIGIHQVGMWSCECSCGSALASYYNSRIADNWNVSSELCPCCEPIYSIPKRLNSWREYYLWRSIPLHSPIALLLHWPLTIYHAIQLVNARRLLCEHTKEMRIHYLGPEKELHQLASFGELRALFPGVKINIQIVGPAVPTCRDGEIIDLCEYTCCADKGHACKSQGKTGKGSPRMMMLHMHRGFYHDRYEDITTEADCFPDLIIAANAGIAAYTSWLPTLEMMRKMKVPLVITDYCEEACHLAARCISSVTGWDISIPIQLNPFRHPVMVEESTIGLPCYSNCFIFGV